MVHATSGLIVISGCGHAGIANTLETHARLFVKRRSKRPSAGSICSPPPTRNWSGRPRLKAVGIRHLLGAHCTGIEAVFRFRQLTGLARRDAVVGAVGSSYTLGTGIEALVLAR